MKKMDKSTQCKNELKLEYISTQGSIMRILCIVMILCGSALAGLRSDLNNDGVVNVLDFVVLAGEWLDVGAIEPESRSMNNAIYFPPRIFAMDKILLADHSSLDTSYYTVDAAVSGSTRNISGYSDLGGGVVQATVNDHCFLTGEAVLFEGTGAYDGERIVTRINANTVTFIDTYNGGAALGTMREPDDRIVYSPLDGLPAVKCIGKSGHNSVWTFTFDAAQTLYPNSGIIVKTVGYVDVDGSLNTSVAATGQYPPISLVSEESAASVAWSNSYHYTTSTKRNGFSGQWRYIPQVRRHYAAIGSPKAWCTAKANQGFTTNSISFSRTSSATENEVFYIGGVVTEDIPVAKLIIGFDNMRAEAYANTASVMHTKGWRGVVYATGILVYDDPNYFERVNDLYGDGWDIGNHSWEHVSMDNTLIAA